MWFWLVFYIFCMELYKFCILNFMDFVNNFLFLNFGCVSLQSSMFFKFFFYVFVVFWLWGLIFPLFSPWSCVGFLFFMASFSWLGVRTYYFSMISFFIVFELDHSWSWVSSLIMFFSHWLSFLMSALALVLRISIIFLIGHFLMFIVLGCGFFCSFFFLFFVIIIEFGFALLQSYIFLTLIYMFLLNMV